MKEYKGYKIGDKVKLKSWAELCSEYEVNNSGNVLIGDFEIPRKHKHKYGKEYTIESMNKKYIFFEEITEKFINEEIRGVEDRDFIFCPIEMVKANLTSNLGIRFNDGFSMLSYDKDCYVVVPKTKVRRKPTPHSELEVGKWYVEVHIISDNLKDTIQEKYNYLLYMGEETFVYMYSNLEIMKSYISDSYNYHEVVEDKEE